jgi:hypothetical protein
MHLTTSRPHVRCYGTAARRMCDVMREIWFEFAGELYPRAAEAESFKLVRDRERCRRSSLFQPISLPVNQ